MFYEYYSHILLIPLVSGYLLTNRRSEIWVSMKPSIPAGVLVGAFGIIGYGSELVQGGNFDLNDSLMVGRTQCRQCHKNMKLDWLWGTLVQKVLTLKYGTEIIKCL